MSTRCLIAIRYEDQRYESTYCHNDGYDYGNGVGPTLRACFNTLEAVKSLVELGDVSYVHSS